VPELAVRDIELAYGADESRVFALRGVTLALCPGQFTLLVGPSGSGKTSLLTVLGCIVSPDAGSVLLDGQEIMRFSEPQLAAARREKIGFVFQSYRLMESLNAMENIMLALEIRQLNNRRARAMEALEYLGLGSKCKLKAGHLSGGEKQRVAIARAIAPNPGILLADEPTAALDSDNGLKIAGLLRQIAEERDNIVVAVSHDERLKRFAHRTVHIQDGMIIRDTL
jgi:putative ABC transport system ATP-binding protein